MAQSKLFASCEDKVLECSICLSDLIKPKQLPCLHNFCLKCLKGHCGFESKKACPMCRQEFSIPQGGVDLLKDNEFIQRLVLENELSEGKSEAKCELCLEIEEAVEAQAFCVECSQRLCKRCQLLHFKQTTTNHHRVVDINELFSDAELQKMRPQYCSDHSGKEVELYCCDCEKLLCCLCLAAKHNKHECMVIKDIAKLKKEFLMKDQTHLKEQSAPGKSKLKDLNDLKDELQNEVAQAKSSVEESFSKLIHQIMTYKADLLESIEECNRIKLKEIAGEIDMNERHGTELSGFIFYCKMLMERGTDCETVKVADELHNRAEELIKKNIEQNKQSLPEVTVRYLSPPQLTPETLQKHFGSVTFAAQNKDYQSRDIKLHTTENAWKTNPIRYKDSQDLATEDLYKRMHGILNKLTLQKFETLLNQVKNLPIDSEERLMGCVDIVFEKAISEPSFSVVYAQMAKRLLTVNVPTEGDPEETVSFRKLLLNKCQQEFEKDKEKEIDIEQMQLAIDEAQADKKAQLIEERDLTIATYAKAKRRSLGLMRFIGELFKLRMLTEKIMHECIKKFLRNHRDEDSLECLCQLLTSIGQDIDAKGKESSQYMDSYMKDLMEFVDQKLVCARIRFMILEVNDLRKNEWIPRREKNNLKMLDKITREAPLLEEIARQAQIKEQRSQQRKQQQRGGGPHRRGLFQYNLRQTAANDDGWTNVSRAPRATVDPSKMKFSKLDDNISLGLGGRPGIKDNRGESNSNSAAYKEHDGSTIVNRYATLEAKEDSRCESGIMSLVHKEPGDSTSVGYRDPNPEP